jgi:hypothetical protein
MLTPVQITLALALMVSIALLIAIVIIALDDRRERIAQAKHEKRLADIRNGNTPDAIAHRKEMQRVEKLIAENQAKLDAIKNCPDYKKLQDEINWEYFAMIQGLERHNAMINR